MDDIVWSAWKHAVNTTNSIPFTRLYEDLAQVGVRSPVVRILGDDNAKVIDTEVEAQFDACKVRYAPTGTATGTFSTNGTTTGTMANQLTTYHVKTVVDYMYQTMYAVPYDGDNFMCICSTDAKRGVYDEVEDMLVYTKYPATGEFGRYYDTRFMKTNHGLSNAVGSSSAYGEAYFFGGGGGPVCRGIANAMKVIPKEETDYGRSRGLAWYSVEGFKIWMAGDTVIDNNIVKVGSA